MRFGRYLEDLENDFTQGVDRYPQSRVDTHHVLANWKQDPRNLVCLTGGNDGVQFTNMAMTEQELMTQQQQVDTQETNDNTLESEGTTLTTVTTRVPTGGTGGRGWRWWTWSWLRLWAGSKYDYLFQCGQRGHYPSECVATSKEVQQYHASQSQATKHDSGEQLLIQFPPKMDENWLRYELLN